MSGLGLLLAVVAASLLGTAVGFFSGLVPGLHMNNIAAALTAYASFSVGLFSGLCSSLGTDEAGVAISCFLSAALIAHIFAESITSAYVGIPAEDVVSVLPAHRLAKAGFGTVAVQASADGAMAGILLSAVLLFPFCFVMSTPIGFYGVLKKVMVFIVILFSGVLLASEGLPSLRLRPRQNGAMRKVLRGMAIFVLAGLLGTVVLRTNYFAVDIPDFPWIETDFVPRSSLLLPMFAGLFGIPGLLLSLGSRSVAGMVVKCSGSSRPRPGLREFITAVLGGAAVGWMPGLTSGSAVTLCSPATKETTGTDDIEGSVRFIWLYSAISAAGAVFAVGALFAIMRARSGSMDAVSFFIDTGAEPLSWSANILPMSSIMLSMVLAATVCRQALLKFGSRPRNMYRLLSSKELAVSSFVFVCLLSVALTGSRGAVLIAAATCLGLLPPLIGVRRIQLMGSLLVPIILTLVAQA